MGSAQDEPGLLAKFATDKFWLQLTLYRHEQVFLAQSFPINRASMCRWMKDLAELHSPIVQRMRKLIMQSRVVKSGATTLPVIKAGLGKTLKGLVWTYRGDNDHPYFFYDYSDTEHSRYPKENSRRLQGYSAS